MAEKRRVRIVVLKPGEKVVVICKRRKHRHHR